MKHGIELPKAGRSLEARDAPYSLNHVAVILKIARLIVEYPAGANGAVALLHVARALQSGAEIFYEVVLLEAINVLRQLRNKIAIHSRAQRIVKFPNGATMVTARRHVAKGG